MSDTQLNSIQYVVNFRYGGRPVKRVYVGKKLVWQCLDLQGQNESKFHTSLIIYNLIDKIVVGNSKNFLLDSGLMNSVELVIATGKAENFSNSADVCNILNTILLSELTKVQLETKENCEKVRVILLEEKVKEKFSSQGIKTVLKMILMQDENFNNFETRNNYTKVNTSLLQDRFKIISDLQGVNEITNINQMIDNIKYNFPLKNKLEIIKIIQQISSMNHNIIQNDIMYVADLKLNQSDLKECIKVGAIGYVNGELKQNTLIKHFIFVDGIGKAGRAIQNTTSTFSEVFTDIVLNFCNVIKICSKSFQKSKSNLDIFVFPAAIAEGNIATKSFQKGNIKIFPAINNNFQLNVIENFSTNTKALVWFPPIGDNKVLFEENPQRGNVLEIRQAYMVVENKQDMRLEVF